jgi:hypothetical protein
MSNLRPVVAIAVSFADFASAMAAPGNRQLYGPAPSARVSRSIGETAIRQLSSGIVTRIEWPRALVRATLTLPNSVALHGWYTCGYVYQQGQDSGLKTRNDFLIMFRNDKLTLLEIGTSEGIDRATAVCNGLAPKGWLTLAD